MAFFIHKGKGGFNNEIVAAINSNVEYLQLVGFGIDDLNELGALLSSKHSGTLGIDPLGHDADVNVTKAKIAQIVELQNDMQGNFSNITIQGNDFVSSRSQHYSRSRNYTFNPYLIFTNY